MFPPAGQQLHSSLSSAEQFSPARLAALEHETVGAVGAAVGVGGHWDEGCGIHQD